MFTGIITAIGTVKELSPLATAQDMRAVITTPADFLAAANGTSMGASIACSGCCLTVTAKGDDFFAVDISGETLSRTNLQNWAVGTHINLERAARLGDEMGGHIVSGHVDGVGRVLARTSDAGSIRFEIFGVNIIPHTAQHTTLGALAVGDTLHIEIDMLARYVARLVETES